MLSLALSRVGVSYAGVAALSGVTFRASGAALLALAGLAGSGKTTLLKAIAGRIRHAGVIELAEDGRALTHEAVSFDLHAVDLLSQAIALEDFIRLGAASAEGWAAGGACARSTADALELIGLQAKGRAPLCALSPEERKLAAFAARAVAGPRVMLLDEDMASPAVLRALRRYVERERAIGIAANAEDFADRVLRLDAGRLVAA